MTNRPLLASSTLPVQIHEFQLLREIGRGGMGVVYEAIHQRLKRRVALKILSPNPVDRDSALVRFEREMAAIGQLSHPNIVQALDAGEDHGVHYLALEFVDGSDIQRLCQLGKSLNIADACEIVRQAGLGLHQAHKAQVLHRDIKPSNLLLDANGVVKLSDLGLARWMSGAGPEKATVEGTILGTYDYMSPEQAEGKPLGFESDIYNLGATLYRLLAGQPPFGPPEYDSVKRKIFGHLHDPPRRLCMVRTEIPKALDDLVHRMLSKDPQQRPRTALAVVEALEPFVEQANLRSLLKPSAAVAASDITTGTLMQGTTRHERRRRIPHRATWLYYVLTGFSLAIAAATAAYLSTVGRTHQARPRDTDDSSNNLASATVPKLYQDVGIDERQSWIWYPLLQKPPEEVIWKKETLSFLDFDPKLMQCRISSRALGIVSLGEVSTKNYTLQVDLHQNRWPGGCGVLIGLRELTDPPGSYAAQSFYFQEWIGPNSDEFPLILIRSRMILKKEPETNRFNLDWLDQRSIPVQVPTEHARKLEVDVRADGMNRIRWGTSELNELSQHEINSLYSPDDYLGRIGIYTIASEVTVSNAQLLLSH